MENVAWEVAHELQRQGEDVTVLTRDADEAAGVAIEGLSTPTFWQPVRIRRFSRNAADAVARGAYDVVHGFSHTRQQDLFRAGGGCQRDWLARNHTGAALQFRLRSPRHRVRLAIEQHVFENSLQRIQCASRLVADALEREHGVPSERILFLPNAVDAARFAPATNEAAATALRRALAPEAGPVWLFPGSGWHRKGLDTALRALARGRADERLWVAGRDRPRAWIERARRLGVADRVRFLGPRRDLPAVYAAADAVVLPTRYDPFANVTIEAAAAARPIVTTRSNGASEWFGPALQVLEHPGDAAGLAEALTTLRDPAVRRQRGAALRERACAMDWPSHVRTLREEYARIAEAKTARRARTSR